MHKKAYKKRWQRKNDLTQRHWQSGVRLKRRGPCVADWNRQTPTTDKGCAEGISVNRLQRPACMCYVLTRTHVGKLYQLADQSEIDEVCQ